MNSAISNVANRNSSKKLYKMENYYRQGGTRKSLVKEKFVSGRVTFFGGVGKRQGSILQITSLGLIRKFQIDWLKFTFLQLSLGLLFVGGKCFHFRPFLSLSLSLFLSLSLSLSFNMGNTITYGFIFCDNVSGGYMFPSQCLYLK